VVGHALIEHHELGRDPGDPAHGINHRGTPAAFDLRFARFQARITLGMQAAATKVWDVGAAHG
jgi:hypothetical protein